MSRKQVAAVLHTGRSLHRALEQIAKLTQDAARETGEETDDRRLMNQVGETDRSRDAADEVGDSTLDGLLGRYLGREEALAESFACENGGRVTNPKGHEAEQNWRRPVE